ncbi:MAG: vitamin K epoxide reductase family protein [Deltaproteobacteria bacterium]
MKYRMTICFASLVSGLVAFYLHLWKIGLVGPLACSSGGACELVQTSLYGSFLGVDVSLIGTVGYAVLFLASLLSLQPRWADARWPTLLMMAMIWPAVLFTVRLKYGEFVVLRSFCPWCVISAVAIALSAVMVTLDWRRVRGAPAAPGA